MDKEIRERHDKEKEKQKSLTDKKGGVKKKKLKKVIKF